MKILILYLFFGFLFISHLCGQSLIFRTRNEKIANKLCVYGIENNSNNLSVYSKSNDTSLIKPLNQAIALFIEYISNQDFPCASCGIILFYPKLIPVYKTERLYLTPYEIDSTIISNAFKYSIKELPDTLRRKFLNNQQYYYDEWHPYLNKYNSIKELQKPFDTISTNIRLISNLNTFVTNDTTDIKYISRVIFRCGLKNVNEIICSIGVNFPSQLYIKEDRIYSNCSIQNILLDEKTETAVLDVRFNAQNTGLYFVDLVNMCVTDIWIK